MMTCITLTYTSLLVFLDLQEGSQMTLQCCCPLWLNIQTEHVCRCCLTVCLRLVLPSPLPESSTCSPPDGLWEASQHDTLASPVELMTNHVLYFLQTVFVLELD